MSKKKVLITGVTGQDGAILADQLFKKDYEVFGASRRTSHNLWRVTELDLLNKINYLKGVEIPSVISRHLMQVH